MRAFRASVVRFELLEQLSQHQETAYERLYRWVQDRCQTLEEETPAADVTLQVSQSLVFSQGGLLRRVCPYSPRVICLVVLLVSVHVVADNAVAVLLTMIGMG